MCISADLENHNNPQNTKNEDRSFYKVNFNGHGCFVGQEQEPAGMLPPYGHIMIDIATPIW